MLSPVQTISDLSSSYLPTTVVACMVWAKWYYADLFRFLSRLYHKSEYFPVIGASY